MCSSSCLTRVPGETGLPLILAEVEGSVAGGDAGLHASLPGGPPVKI